jgi:hypothetical protein
MVTPINKNRPPNLTRKQLREHSFNLVRLYLPKELEDYLLDLYNAEYFHDDEGYKRYYSEEDMWYGIRKPILEYAQIKRQMDDLLTDSDYLGNCALTIKVRNHKTDFLKRFTEPEPQIITGENCNAIDF